jgi:hypothetical protein
MRRENVIGASLALLVLTGISAHWVWTHPRFTAGLTHAFSSPALAPTMSRPAHPITSPAAPEDAETHQVRESLAPSGVALDRLVVLWERSGRRVYGVVVPGSDALSSWRALRAQVSASGRWPVVLGDGEAVSHLGDVMPYASSVEVILANADVLDTDAWLQARHAQVDAMLPHGAWPMVPQAPTDAQLTIGTDILAGTPMPEVVIALIPSPDPSHVPAWIPYGNVNECPDNPVQIAMFRRWRERYGAVVYGVNGESVEMIVERPPQDRESAMTLAGELGAFDYDIVAQGTESLEGLAATLNGSTIWFFWWD